MQTTRQRVALSRYYDSRHADRHFCRREPASLRAMRFASEERTTAKDAVLWLVSFASLLATFTFALFA